MLKSLFKAVIPLAAIGLATSLSGCDGADIKFDGKEGVPLAELDMSGDAPTSVVLAGPDNIVITDGDELTIDVEGDQESVDAVRFALSDGTLAVMREKDNWSGSNVATIRVTLPALTDLSIGGSGKIDAQSLTGDSSVNIGGSGTVKIASIATDSLDINVGGSGDISGSGTTERLEINIAGSGDVGLSAVTVGNADINIVGSGDAKFASDGNVEANIAGSGNVTVTGNATCTINSLGSGTLTCDSPSGGTPAEESTDADDGEDSES